VNLYKDLASLNEVDWSKVRDMKFNDDRTAKREAVDTITISHCLGCPDFLEHVFPSS